MQAWVDGIIEATRAERMKTSPQLTLGELIRRLEALPLTYDDRGTERQKYVWFDFGQTQPEQVMSWRGSYAELAISFTYDPSENVTAEQFLTMLRGAVGQTFTGYKGGDFTMGEDTPVWVANYGDSGNTGVVGVRDLGWSIVIDTAWCEF